VEAKNDVLFGNTGSLQFIRYAPLCAIMLDPHSTIDQIYMEDTAMDPSGPVPADMDHLIVVAFGVEDGLRFNLTVRRLESAIIGKDSLHNRLVLG
jgi:hypothetical protein